MIQNETLYFGQLKTIARIMDPCCQPVLQLPSLACKAGIKGMVSQLVRIFMKIIHTERLSFKYYIFPAVARDDAAPGAIQAIMVPGGDDQLQIGGIGFVDDRAIRQ